MGVSKRHKILTGRLLAAIMAASIPLIGVFMIKARLIDSLDVAEGVFLTDPQASDPLDDEELCRFAIESGATHLCVETGCYYKLNENLEVYFFRRNSDGVIYRIRSGLEAFELDYLEFIPCKSGGSSIERALRSIPNYWKFTGKRMGAIVLCGAPSTGKTWLCSELNKQGFKNHESYSLYGLGAADAGKALSILREELAYHDSKKLGHLIFSTTSLELAKELEHREQVFYIQGSPMRAISKSLTK